MSESRVRGQEVVLRIARGNVPEATITAFKSITIQYDFATIEEGYLGETTMRKDDIFNGLSGTLEVDHESQDLLLFLDFLKRRAQREISVVSNRVNATARFTFPNGQTPKVLVRDMKFDAIPVNIPGRAAYVNSSLPWKAEDGRVLTL